MSLPLNVIIASAVRTPVGRGVKGALKDTRPDDLAAVAMVAALSKVPGLSAAAVDDVVLGCAMPEAEQGLNVARNAAFIAGLPNTVAAETINRFCSSGLQAIAHAGLVFAGWVANCIQPDMKELERNVATLRQRLDAPMLARIPFRAGITPQQAAPLFQLTTLLASHE